MLTHVHVYKISKQNKSRRYYSMRIITFKADLW